MHQNKATKAIKGKGISKGKRFVSLLLCFAMTMGFVPFGVFAPKEVQADVFPGWTYSESYGGSALEEYGGITPTADGGYAIVLLSNSGDATQYWSPPPNWYPTSNYIVLMKFDSNNVLEWSNTYDAIYASPLCRGIVQTPDGGYAFLSGNNIFKTDSLGNLEWRIDDIDIYAATEPPMVPYTALVTELFVDGNNIIVTGNSKVAGPGMFIASVSNTGSLLWKNVNPAPIGEIRDLVVAPNGNYIVTAIVDGIGKILTVDPTNGNIINTLKTYPNGGFCTDIDILPNGDYLIGDTNGLHRLDSTGVVIDSALMAAGVEEVEPAVDGGYYICQYMTILKCDANMDLVWHSDEPSTALTHFGPTHIQSFTTLSDGSLVFAGGMMTSSLNPPYGNAGIRDLVVLGLDENIELTLSATPATPIFNNAQPVTVTAQTDNNLIDTNFDIEATEWFRVPLTDATDYRAVGTSSVDFDSKYATVAAADKGTLPDTNASDTSQTLTHTNIDKNGKYWYKTVVSDGTNDVVDVECVEIDNFYTQSVVQRKGIETGNGSNVLYPDEINTMDNSTPPVDYVTNKVGVAYDLNSTTNIVSSTSDGLTIVANTGIATTATTDDVYATLNVVPKNMMPYWLMPPLAIPVSNPINVNSSALSMVIFEYAKDLPNWADLTVYAEDESGNTVGTLPHSSSPISPTLDKIKMEVLPNYTPVPHGEAPLTAPSSYYPIGFYYGTTPPANPSDILPITSYDPDGTGPIAPYQAAVIPNVTDSAYTITFVYGNDDPLLGDIEGHIYEDTGIPGDTSIPIAGATVTTSTGEQATTDANGYYKIYDVPAGTHNVIASHTNHNTGYATNVVVTTSVVTQNLWLTKNTGGGGTDDTYIVQGTITDAATTLPLTNGGGVTTGAKADVNNSGTYGTLSGVDSKGNYVIGPFDASDNVKIEGSSLPGYVSENRTITAIAADTDNFDFALRAPVEITVEGKDGTTVLYSYKLTQSFSTTQFNLVSNYVPGYKVVSAFPTNGTLSGTTPDYMTVPVTPNANQTITFEYDTNTANVTIEAYNDTGSSLITTPDFSSYTVPAEIGYAYTAEPPVIPGYTYTGTADRNGDVVATGGNTIRFHYTQNTAVSGNYTVYAVDDADGTLIGSEVRTLANPTLLFNVVNADAPTSIDIAALSGYTLVAGSGSPASISYDGVHEPRDVYYRYTRNTQPITVNHYLDGTTTPVAPSDTTTYANAKVGERYVISAPAVANYTVVGDTVKDFVLGTTAGDNVVNFYYEAVPAGQSSMEVIYYYMDGANVKHTIQKTDYVSDTGTNLNYTAPATLAEGWTLNDTATKTGIFGTDTKLEFKYTRTPVTLTIQHEDVNNPGVPISPLPANVVTSMTVDSGEDVVITAPFIPGYEVEAPSVITGSYTSNQTITFYYTDSEPAMVDITKTSQVVAGPTDALVVPQPVPLPFPTDIDVINQNSGNQTVSVKNFPSLGFIPGYVAVGYQVDSNPYVSTYTPATPLVPAANIDVTVDTTANHTVMFSYKVDADIDGIPDEYEIADITVRGEDNGTVLYEYSTTMSDSAPPFNLVSNYVPGYKVVSALPTNGTLSGTTPDYMTVPVTPNGDKTITFEYDTNTANVTIEAYNDTGSSLITTPDFSSYTVPAEIGYAYTAEPPVIPGYTYTGTADRNGDVVAAGGNTIRFHYTQNTAGNGNYTVYAVDDADGTLIGSEVRNLPNPTLLFNVVNADAPTSIDIAALSGYTLVAGSGSPASISYDGVHEPKDVYYRYTRNTQPITINHYLDGTTTPVAPSDTTTYANAKVGERYVISAPAVANYTVVGDTVKDFVLGTTAGDNVVNFYYEAVPAGQSSMEVIYYYMDGANVKHTIQKTDYVSDTGTNLNYTAPATLAEGWTLNDTATKTGIFGTDTKLEFKYTRTPVTLTIDHKDASNGNVLISPLPANVVTSMTVDSGENVVITAPFIPGYEVEAPSVITGSYTSNQTITFYYTDSEPAMVDITKASQVVAGPTDALVVPQPVPLPFPTDIDAINQNSGNQTVSVKNFPSLGFIPGYVAVGYQVDSNPYVSTYTPATPLVPAANIDVTVDTTANHTVMFSYKVDADIDGIPDEYEIADITVRGEDNGTVLYEYSTTMSDSAPPFNLVSNYVPGYKVVSALPTNGTLSGTTPDYMTVPVTPNGDKTITFEYDTNTANVTIEAYNDTGSVLITTPDFSSYTVPAEIGYAYTAEPPVIPGYTYTGTADRNGDVVAAGGNTIRFHYTQNTAGNGNYTVYAVDDADGTLIGSEVRTLANPTLLFNVVNADAPTSTDIAALSSYTLVAGSGSPASISYDGVHEPRDVYYRYTRNTQPITINHYLDGTTTPVAPSDTTTYANAKVGERYVISAPAVANYTVVGDTVKDFVLGTTAGDNVVNFYYEAVPAGQSSMEVIYYYMDGANVKHTIQKTDYVSDTGTNLNYTAPATLAEGWTLNDTATKTGIFGTDTKLEFKYTRTPVTLTIDHKDASNGNVLISPLPANVVTSMTVDSGENVVITAPFIPGYEVEAPSVITGSYTSNQTLTFYYTDSEPATVDITTTSVVVTGNNIPIAIQPVPLPLGPTIQAVTQGSTPPTISALNPPTPGFATGFVAVGYEIDSNGYVSMYTPLVPPVPAPASIPVTVPNTTANHTVKFSYMVDGDGDGIPDEYQFVDMERKGTVVAGPADTPVVPQQTLFTLTDQVAINVGTHNLITPNDANDFGYVAVGYKLDGGIYTQTYVPGTPPYPPALPIVVPVSKTQDHSIEFYYKADSDDNNIPDELESVVITETGTAAENDPHTPIPGVPQLYNVNENALTSSATYTVVPNGVTNYVVVGHKIDGGTYVPTYTTQNPPVPVDLSLSNAVVSTATPHTVEFYYKVDANVNRIPDEDEMITITIMTDTPNNGVVQYDEYEVLLGTDHVVYAPYMLDNNNDPYVVTSRQMNPDPAVTSGPALATQVIEDIQEDKVVYFTYNTPINLANLHDLHIYTTTGTALDFTSAASIAVEDMDNVDAYPPQIDGWVVVSSEIATSGNPFNGNSLTSATALTPVNFQSMYQDERILFYYLVDGNGNEIPDAWEVEIFQYFESDLGVQIPGYPMVAADAINFDSFTAHPPTIPLWIFESATRDGVPMTFNSNNDSTFTVSDQDTTIRYVYTADADGNGIPDKNQFKIKIMKSFDGGVTSTLDHTENVILGQSLTVQAPVMHNYHPVSYRIDSNALVPFARAQVTLTNVNANSTVLFIYERDAQGPPPPPTPTEPLLPDTGNPGGSGNPDPEINPPTITVPIAPIEPILVGVPDEEVPLGITDEEVALGIEDEEVPLGDTDFGVTETFMKLPNKTIVSLGEYVDYTLKGVMNPYPGEVAQYSIGDIPPKGLTFVKGTIPSFENAEGVTYDVVYKTNFADERMIATDLDATQPFYFDAPILEDGEYITEIVLRFNDVPAGFAQNNEIVYTFQVTEGSPGDTLVNKGYITFRVGDEDFYIESGGGGISMHDGDSSAMTTKNNPSTGVLKAEFVTMAITLVAIAGTTLILYKKRKNA